jgi:hypothetical protein
MSASVRTLVTALLLTAISFVTLLDTEPSVGIVRDEGIYMAASRRYGAWVEGVRTGDVAIGDRAPRDRAFRVNAEHPALMKIVAGLTAEALATPREKTPPAADDAGGSTHLRESTTYRMPAMAIASLGVGLLYLLGVQLASPIAALLAACGFLLLPRVFFHAHLHCFDVPVSVWILAVAACWFRAGTSRLAGLSTGLVLGLAVSTKHNALFMLPLVLGHEGLTWSLRWYRTKQRPPWRAILTLRVCSVLLLTPLVVLATWPWLWADTSARMLEYLQFHREHAYYNMEFLGTNYNEPPMPISYPFVMTLATVPWTLLALAVTGAWSLVREDVTDVFAATSAASPARRSWDDFWTPHLHAATPSCRGLGLVALALFPLLLISLPSVPIFGGTKHWMTAYPFVLLLASVGLHRLTRGAFHNLSARRRAVVAAACVVCILSPAALSTASSHPFETAQYNGIVGGAQGGARLGLNRSFWGHAIEGLFDDRSDANPLYLHDVHPLAARQYRRDGRWPTARSNAPLHKSKDALLFYEKHMTADEVRIWNDYGTTRPAAVLTVEDVPVTSLYQRSPPRTAP